MANIISIKNEKSSRSNKRKLVLGLVIVCAVVAVGFGGKYLYDTSRPKSDAPTADNTSASKTATQAMYDDAYKIANNESYGAAQNMLNEKADAVAGNYEKAEVYRNKAVLALNSSNYEDAMTAALKTEELYPTSSSAELVGLVAEQSGNKPEAIKYYNLALGRYSEQAKKYPEYQNLQATIERLSA